MFNFTSLYIMLVRVIKFSFRNNNFKLNFFFFFFFLVTTSEKFDLRKGEIELRKGEFDLQKNFNPRKS